MTVLRRLLLALLLCGLLAAATAASAAQGDDPLIPREDPNQLVTITLADGSTKELTRGELVELQRKQQKIQTTLQNNDEPEWVERQSIDEIQRRDPQLARQIRVAAAAFAILQQHGYARGYALSSFSEVDVGVVAGQREDAKKKELRITMQLRASVDSKSKVAANSGMSASRHGAAPATLAYEVDVLLDSNDGVSVVKAWQLLSDDTRGKQLTIKPSEELLKRYSTHRQQLTAGSPLGEYGIWMLGGGVLLIVVGVAMVFLSSQDQPPAPTPPAAKPATSPRDSGSTTSPNTTATKRQPKRKDAKSVTQREAGDGWELAN